MRLLVTGGGTGGHIFPGIAVIKAVQKKLPHSEVMFVSTSRAMDKEIFSQVKLKTSVINCSALKGTTLTNKILSVLQQPSAVYQAYKIIKRFKPEVVFGVGGYVTGPVILAAKLCGIPICIHEQNSIPGLTNKLTGKIADTICISIPGTKGFPVKKTVQTGNPVRQEILQLRGQQKIRKHPPTIIVLGGSQGAHRVNELVVAAVKILVDQGVSLKLIHQTGKLDCEMVSTEYKKIGIDARVEPFIDDMASIYAKADLAISRAGATTLAELSCLGLAAVLIPFPFAADDHQQANAEYYAVNAGCEVHREKELTGNGLAEAVSRCLLAPDTLLEKGEKMASLGMPDAAECIVEQCLQLIKEKK